MLQELASSPRPRDVAAEPVTVVALGRALELLEYVIRQTPPDLVRTRDLADFPRTCRRGHRRATAAALRLGSRVVHERHAASATDTRCRHRAARNGSAVERRGRRVATASCDYLLTDLHPAPDRLAFAGPDVMTSSATMKALVLPAVGGDFVVQDRLDLHRSNNRHRGGQLRDADWTWRHVPRRAKPHRRPRCL